MKQLTRLAVERPLTILMVILALVIMGVRGYTMLNVDRFPKVDFPVVSSSPRSPAQRRRTSKTT